MYIINTQWQMVLYSVQICAVLQGFIYVYVFVFVQYFPLW